MRIRPAGVASALVVSLFLLLTVGCSRKAGPTRSQTPAAALTAVATAAAATVAASATAGTTATATAPAGPNIGATIQIGNVSVVVDRFRAVVSDPAGVNIRSAPQVTPDNRTGSLAPGAIVEVEGRVLQGQEAEPGNGTLWYFVGLTGTTPQFIYGAPGTLTPLTGSATPAPISSATPPAAGTPILTPPLTPPLTPTPAP